MKLFSTLLILAITTVNLHAQEEQSPQMQTQGSSIQWFTDYQSAMQMAQKERKPLILYFTGSDWCGWCKKMDSEIFSSPEFTSAVGSKFIFVKLDFPMNQKLPQEEIQQNAQLKQRYGVTGYPTIVIVDASGGFLGQTGYRSGGGKAYANYLDSFLGK
ncbi:MAG: Disulfide bond reductase DsbH [Chlamydiales bacterium]|nr:Disulfide bond reductase DsbH [Chlamydiales bacterium]MCH9619899.1 Disulfide bond reductase DsbH [Chlamydiales bacterium]MCH9622674.1 Disulfide bond reductase DsbH [Chlamydiales bacterium]